MNTKYWLRGLELEDLDSLFAIENDTHLWKYSNRSTPYTKAFLTEYILQSHLPIQEAQQLRLALVDDSDQAKGFVDLFEVDLHHQRAGVGIAIHPEYQNQGLGAVGLSLLLDYCHSYLSLHQLYCDIDENNKVSIRLFEKAGFEQTGLKKDWNFYEKEFHSVRMYQKIEL
jgi:diamine N-acetyltransferase|tara:strand:+ start:1241 stop:1750 length:510 start_codon:yes stop_codon:yes gene_type:complete